MAVKRKKSPLVIEVYAKINLTLRLLGRMNNGYHSIETVFQNITLSDRLTVRPTGGEIAVSCDNPAVPEGPDNLAFQAAEACLGVIGLEDTGLEVRIKKGIPVGSGLGGASTDAAGVILACEHLFGPLPGGQTTIYEIAGSLGADVPFFLCGGRALAWGIGERMLPLPVDAQTPVLLVLPEISISTTWAYRAFDDAASEGSHHEIEDANGGPLKWNELIGPLGPEGGMFNDFEPMVFAHHPELRDLKLRLIELGAAAALMSGSGSALFGLFSDERRRDEAKKLFGKKEKCRLVSATFINRANRIVI